MVLGVGLQSEPAHRSPPSSGRKLGLAFQIRDDFLGVWGDESLTGKPSGSDIRRRKKSLPIIFAFEQAPRASRAAVRRLFAQPGPLTPAQEGQVLAILEACAADEFTREQVELHRNHAMSALTEPAGGPDALAANPYLTQLADLAEFAGLRGF